MRIKIIRVIIILGLLCLAADLVYTQGIRGSFYYHQSVNNRIRVIPLDGIRGRILDRNGVVLADNRLSFNVAMIPQDIKENDQVFHYLSQVLNVKKSKLFQQYSQKKHAPFAPVVVAEDVDKKVAMILEENKFRFPGLYVQEHSRRYYPMGSIGAHLIGQVGKINRTKMEKLKDYGYTPLSIVGYSGIEEYYDHYLKGKEGGLQIEVNSRGQQVRLLSMRDAESGEDVHLTIDARIQQIAQEALGNRKGAIVILDFDSGEILGMVSSPTYDPNIFVDHRLQGQISFAYSSPDAPLLNRAIQGQYPPGSVFKIILTVAALANKRISRHTTFNCPGYYTLGKRQFRCAHVHNAQNLIEAIAHSCNVYFFNTGLLIGPDQMYKYARLLGLGEVTHVDLPAEERGFLPSRRLRRIRNPTGWYKGDTLNYSIGQGEVLATPLQVARMTATVGRSGKEVQPFLIKKIGEQDIVQFSTVRLVNLAPEIFTIVQEGLKGAVKDPHGTARLLDMPGFKIFGKTGTAQSVPGKDEHAWFAGYSLEGKKRVSFCVFLEYGGSSYNAVVLTRELFQRLRIEDIL
jgi:penicillin-binding protein 2